MPIPVVAEDAITPTSTPVKQETVQRTHSTWRGVKLGFVWLLPE